MFGHKGLMVMALPFEQCCLIIGKLLIYLPTIFLLGNYSLSFSL